MLPGSRVSRGIRIAVQSLCLSNFLENTLVISSLSSGADMHSEVQGVVLTADVIAGFDIEHALHAVIV